MNRRRVAVLGSTGSIGRQALEIISREPGLALHSIVCRSSTGLLSEQMAEYSPAIAGAVEPQEAPPAGVFTGEHAVDRAMEEADVVLNAIVGSAGLRASLLAQKTGKPLALANKESLVVGGDLLREHLTSGAVIPVDSEHSTIFRCLLGEDRGVSSITLTASGGSCRSMTPEEVLTAGPERILRHPTWNMGARITVDSASMVNKAFEVIEARWLFPDVPVNAVIHPQSIVHSLVRLEDGSWKALLGEPDMRIPIQFALQYPAGRLHRREVPRFRIARLPDPRLRRRSGRRCRDHRREAPR